MRTLAAPVLLQIGGFVLRGHNCVRTIIDSFRRYIGVIFVCSSWFYGNDLGHGASGKTAAINIPPLAQHTHQTNMI